MNDKIELSPVGIPRRAIILAFKLLTENNNISAPEINRALEQFGFEPCYNVTNKTWWLLIHSANITSTDLDFFKDYAPELDAFQIIERQRKQIEELTLHLKAAEIVIKDDDVIKTKDKRGLSSKRTPIRADVRYAVLVRDNFRCKYCGRSASEVELHVDHILPVSKGGSNSLSNYTTSCKDCNLGKHDKLLLASKKKGKMVLGIQGEGQIPSSLIFQ